MSKTLGMMLRISPEHKQTLDRLAVLDRRTPASLARLMLEDMIDARALLELTPLADGVSAALLEATREPSAVPGRDPEALQEQADTRPLVQEP
jgi:hypothetical protein